MGETVSVQFVPPESAEKRRRNGNIRPLPVLIPLDQPGRLRKGHLLSLLGIGSTTLRNRLEEGSIPGPDGHDGYVGKWERPYWNTATIRAYLTGEAQSQIAAQSIAEKAVKAGAA